jgi:hypothetical protein
VDFVVDESGQGLVNDESAKPILCVPLQFIFISHIVLVLQNVVLNTNFMFEKDINLAVFVKD